MSLFVIPAMELSKLQKLVILQTKIPTKSRPLSVFLHASTTRKVSLDKVLQWELYFPMYSHVTFDNCRLNLVNLYRPTDSYHTRVSSGLSVIINMFPSF